MKKSIVSAILLLVFLAGTAQQKSLLNSRASLLFKGIKTNLTVQEKNSIADACGLTLNKSKTKFIAEMDDLYTVKAYVTDMNSDGIEEIFVNQSGTSFGNTGNYFDLFFKNTSGQYVKVVSEISLPIIMKTKYNGYPELILGGPGMTQPVWRFNGKIYQWNRSIKDQEIYGAGIEEASAAYLSGEKTKPEKDATTPAGQNPKQVTEQAISNEPSKPIVAAVALSPLAQFLFRNNISKLSTIDKNELTMLMGLTAADTTGQGKNNKPKVEYTIYPLDFDRNGVEEIFIKATTKFLGIPTHQYSFFVKDRSGHYKPKPGKFGNGAKIIINSKSPYPDLLAKPLVSDGTGNLNVWSWNGTTYYIQKRITLSESFKFKQAAIEDKSYQYTNGLE